MRLIGINGYARSGKDTVCRFIDQLSPARVQRTAYADRMKLMAARSLGFDRSESELIELMNSIKLASTISVFYDEPTNPSGQYDDNAVFQTLTGRQFLQNFGEDGRQTFGENFWIDLVLPQPALPQHVASMLDSRYPDTEILVVADVRHTNEAKRIIDLGGEMWHVVRPGIESDGHITEMQLPPWLIDRTIINDGSLDHLRDRVQEALHGSA